MAAIGPNGTSVRVSLIHVNSNAAANGGGSLAAPFQTLAAASAAASPGAIFYAHADSVFAGESIVLGDNQRLLGAGLNYTIDTNLGPIVIPRATNGTAAPLILNAPLGGAAIVLGNDTEVSNFQILQSFEAGIGADGVTGSIRIANNNISDAFRGIDIRNSDAAFTIEDNTISNTVDSAVELTDNLTGGTIAFTGTTTIDNPGNPLTLPPQANRGIGVNLEGGSATTTFENLVVTNRSSAAVAIGDLDTTGTVTFNQPLTFDNPGGSPDEAIGITNSDGVITFGDVTLTDMNRLVPGQPQVLIADSNNVITFGQMNITSTNGGGLTALNFGTLNVAGGTIDVSGGTGALVSGGTTTDITFDSISASNTAIGVSVARIETGTFLVQGVDGQPGSGGTLNVTEDGINLFDAIGTTFNNMMITSAENGLAAGNSDDIRLSNSILTGTADNYTGVFILNTDQEQKVGRPVILTSNTITSSNNNVVGIHFQHVDADQGDLRLDNQVITLTGIPSLGIDVRAIENLQPGAQHQNGPGDIVLSGNQMNTVTVPAGQQATDNTQMNANIFGNAIVNGVLFP